MGIEFVGIDMEELENILHEVVRSNDKDMTSFRQILLDMYGGIDIRRFDKLEEFIRNKLGLHNDAEIYGMSEEQKRKIIEYLS